ncbi:hypothetical protein Rhopal_005206-T1 [Rhodotorula paludigena]|uniref:N-acetyltransferase domain-containing protein n=1 Tax=Rhodotorula paludigena TaxID=86838 RepID=A0AAV5GHQ3_9BASI|nr:hypothetical protein Rhopal_005206-T1 [Rhodotorula paludigena]
MTAATYNAPLVGDGNLYTTVLCESPEQMQRALDIRYKVFVEEQGYDAAIEVDALDPLCDHLLLTVQRADGTLADVGTLRFYPPKLKLGRVAVHKAFRGTGAGKRLCEALEEHVRERRGKTGDVLRGKDVVVIQAHAQKIAEKFYTKIGWNVQGPDFVEEGQPHCQVIKRVKLSPEVAPATLTTKKPRTYRVQLCEDFERCLKIRIAVFVDEQGFTMEDELDDKDESSDHFIMTMTNEDGTEEDAGTIRWWPKPGLAAGKIGRVCVLPKFRGGGTGKLLMQAVEDHLHHRRGKAGVALHGKTSVKALVHSQMHAEGFYARSGYVREGEQFMEDGAPHCLLVKTIELVPETA